MSLERALVTELLSKQGAATLFCFKDLPLTIFDLLS